MTTHHTYKSPTIVKSKTVLEEITFRGMFGYRSSKHLKNSSESGIKERTIEY